MASSATGQKRNIFTDRVAMAGQQAWQIRWPVASVHSVSLSALAATLL